MEEKTLKRKFDILYISNFLIIGLIVYIIIKGGLI